MGRHIYENPARPAHWTEAAMKAAVAKVYIVSFRSSDDRRPSKFIVLADNMKSAIKDGVGTRRRRFSITLR
jgi:hypothetical protein